MGVAIMLIAFSGFILASRDRDSELALKGRSKATVTRLIHDTSIGADQLLTVGDRAKKLNASLPLSKAPIEAAETFNLASDALDYSPALLCLASAVYHEAGFEPLSGRRAVAQVVLNRLRHPAFPKSVCGVVFQGAGSPVCQFSFACNGSQLRAPAADAWRQSVNVAAAALAGHIEASVGMATHYHADYVAPRWAPLLPKIAQIGTHIFYRWPGDWGRRRAFRGRYRGENGTPLHHVKVPAVELAAIEAMKTGKVRAVGVLEIDNGETSALMVHGGRDGSKLFLDAGDVPLPPLSGKAITVTLIARLVERGALEWDTPLKQLLPDLVATMRPEYQEVKLIELLSHRSGLPGSTDTKFLQSFRDDTRSLPDQRRAYLQRALTEAPAGKRGSYTYSDNRLSGRCCSR